MFRNKKLVKVLRKVAKGNFLEKKKKIKNIRKYEYTYR